MPPSPVTVAPTTSLKPSVETCDYGTFFNDNECQSKICILKPIVNINAIWLSILPIECGKSYSANQDHDDPLFFVLIDQKMAGNSHLYCVGTPLNRDTILVAKHCITAGIANITVLVNFVDFYFSDVTTGDVPFYVKNIIEVNPTENIKH